MAEILDAASAFELLVSHHNKFIEAYIENCREPSIINLIARLKKISLSKVETHFHFFKHLFAIRVKIAKEIWPINYMINQKSETPIF